MTRWMERQGRRRVKEERKCESAWVNEGKVRDITLRQWWKKGVWMERYCVGWEWMLRILLSTNAWYSNPLSQPYTQDSMQFLSGSLDGLCEALKNKVRRYELFDHGCPECGFPKEGHECADCASKRSIESVFPRTSQWVTQTFGADHLRTLLGKHVRKEREREIHWLKYMMK